MRGIEFWAGGDVRSRNIGPAVGDRFLGKVEGPGLYFWLGANTSGKSHHYRLIAKLQKERLLRSDADISDGADFAYIELGAARMSFRRLPTGEVLEPTREGTESLPPIEELPTPIETLITGANLKGKEPRARARLEALLTYTPIPSTEDLVRELCAVLEDRAFSDDPGRERRDLWTLLAERAKGEKTRTKIEPFRTSDEIVAALLASPREGILDDHSRLLDVLNGLANTGEKVAEQQNRVVSEAAGRLKEAVSAGAGRLGVADDGALLSRLRERLTLPEPAAAAVSTAREKLAGLRSDRRRQGEEEARRAALRQKHGARPDDGPARSLFGAAEAAHDAAEARTGELRLRVAAAEAALNAARPRGEVAREKVGRVLNDWHAANAAVHRLFWPGEGETPGSELVVPAPAGLEPALAEVKRRLAALTMVVFDAASEFGAASKASEELTAARSDLAAAERAETEARGTKLAREAEVDAIAASVASWQETDALLASPVPGPTDAEVAETERAVAEAEGDAELWRAAQDFQRAAAVHDQEQVVARWFEGVAADLRGAASESWKHLGQIVTDTLSLPWLMVSGLRMILVYDGKGSNARLARTPQEAKDARDLDDPDRISTAELHEAVLKLMLSRRERLGGILIVPWQVMAALDERRLGVFSGWSRAAGLVTFSERPRRKGDPEDLVLEFVEPIEEAPVPETAEVAPS